MKLNGRFGVKALDWAVPLGFGSVLCLLAPLRTALQFGNDEGFELMKALLVSLGHPLYSEVWNDQPPLHTEIVAVLFRLFGPTALLARLVSIGFASLLVASLYNVVRHRSGRLGGLLAIIMLTSSYPFLQLSVSVMLELPAMAVAMASVWAWSTYFLLQRRRWLLLSGSLFACALQTKLTAAIFLPAFAIDYLISQHVRNRGAKVTANSASNSSWGDAAIWLATTLGVFGLILLAFYRWDTLMVFWVSHFSTDIGRAAASELYAFRLVSVQDNLALWLPATAGLVLAGFKRNANFAFPGVLLAIALVVHLWHRPWWEYYSVHFAIPLTWLGAASILEGFRLLWRNRRGGSIAARVGSGVGVLVWSMVVSLVLTLLPERLWTEVLRLTSVQSADQDYSVAFLRQQARQTQWVFTDQLICAFWAGIPVPPELAVIPSKRVWSAQITPAAVLQSLERYQPELIYLQEERIAAFNLARYIQDHYRSNAANLGPQLYIRK